MLLKKEILTKTIFGLLFFFGVSVFFSSCKKEDNLIGVWNLEKIEISTSPSIPFIEEFFRQMIEEDMPDGIIGSLELKDDNTCIVTNSVENSVTYGTYSADSKKKQITITITMEGETESITYKYSMSSPNELCLSINILDEMGETEPDINFGEYGISAINLNMYFKK